MSEHPIADALRMFDLALTVILMVALLVIAWKIYHRRPVNALLLLALGSWWLTILSDFFTDIIRLGQAPDGRLTIRLVAHGAGVVFSGLTLLALREGRDPFVVHGPR